MTTGEGIHALCAADFSQTAQMEILEKAWELWKIQARKYCGLDNTSVSAERAQALLESSLYTISIATDGAMPQGDFGALLLQGQEILRQKRSDAKAKWQRLRAAPPPVQNIYFDHTMVSLASFFKHYDIYYEAHLLPCDIAYWPICPVSDGCKGVSYVEEYLRRLQWETDFLRCFRAEQLRKLYECYIPHYSEMLFNLCEPVLWNAIGLALLRKSFFPLTVTAEKQQELLKALRGKGSDELQDLTDDAVVFICRAAGIRDADMKAYLRRSASELTPHLRTAVSNGDISRVFLKTE